MRIKHIYILAAMVLSLSAFFPAGVTAQEYVAPKVVISKEKVRFGGKVYYSHVVEERQTIYSISKAYGVTMEEIYDANPALKLETAGLKKDQILLIPFKENAGEVTQASVEPQVKEAPKEAPKPVVEQRQEPQDYFIHKVKWYEDLDAIAKKYKVSKESIININRMTSDKVRRKQELKIPRDPSAWEGLTVSNPAPDQTDVDQGNPDAVFQPSDSAAVAKDNGGNFLDDLFVREGRHNVDISMLIPFSSTKSGDRVSFMDFYCGALLAARSLGKDGVNLDIHSYDVAGGNMPVTHERLSSSDFTIGPVSKADILKASGIG